MLFVSKRLLIRAKDNYREMLAYFYLDKYSHIDNNYIYPYQELHLEMIYEFYSLIKSHKIKTPKNIIYCEVLKDLEENYYLFNI